MDLDTNEIRFAQQLASNEKKTRDKSLKKLKKYLQMRSKKKGFTHEDFLKIWKGLHYCMWMQDKPLLQEELSTKISELVHDLVNNESRWLFIKVFIQTEAREWNSIDVWRVDKFLMLFRAVMTESLEALKNQNWKWKAVEGLLAVFSDTILNVSEDIPFSLRGHFFDLFLDELNKVGGSKIDAKLFVQILDPFIKLLQEVKNPDNEICKRLIGSIFDPIILRTARLNSGKGSNKGERKFRKGFIPFPDLQIDSAMLTEHLFDFGKDNAVSGKTRSIFYQLSKRLQDASDGVRKTAPEMPKEAAIPRKMFGGAVASLLELETKLNWKPSKKELKEMKKQKKANKDKENSGGIVDISMETIEEPGVVIGKKRKMSETADDEEAGVSKAKRKVMDEIDELAAADNGEASATNNIREQKTPKSGNKKQKKRKMKDMKKELQNGAETPTDSKITPVVNKDVPISTLKETPKTTDNKSKSSELSTAPVTKGKGKTPSKKLKTPQKSGHISISGEKSSDSHELNKAEETVINTKSKCLEGKETSKSGENPGTRKRKISDNVVSNTSSCDTLSPAEQVQTNSASNEQFDEPDSAPVSQNVSKNSQTFIEVKPSTDLEEGEVEIFVPSKKYKGKVGMKPAPETPKFAQFESKNTPIAFVKRALAKTNTPTYIKKKSATPSSAGAFPGSAKKVSFNMKKNQSQSFKDSLKSPIVPFNPRKTPDQSILKPACSSTPGVGAARRSVRHASRDTPPSAGSLKGLKTLKRTPKSGTPKAPIMSLNARIKRKVAADYFAL